jgi:uncharacterized protein (TIGR02246 family)
MNKYMTHLVACLLVALATVQPALAQKTDASSIVDAANTTWNKAFNSGDAHALAALYDDKATVSPGNGKSIQGRTEIEKLFKGYFDQGVHNHSIEVIDAHRSGNVVYEVANWRAEGAEKDGKTPEHKGVLLKVMTRSADGKWRSTSHVWNAAP